MNVMTLVEGRAKGRIPGDEGIWVMVFGDMTVFGLFFLVFSYYQAHSPEVFEQSRLMLSMPLGLTNTLILLTSSWLVAIAVQNARTGHADLARRLFLCAVACGILFIAIKGFEYIEKFEAGINIQTNDFFMYYFIFTGVHLMHVVIGIGALIYAVSTSAERAPAFNRSPIDHQAKTFETCATFWHLIDLLWVVLFAVLYLMG